MATKIPGVPNAFIGSDGQLKNVSNTGTVTTAATGKVDTTYGQGSATGAAAKSNVDKVNSDSAFASSEATRAQNVIAERKKAGLDTSAQEKYLTYVNSVVSKNNANNTPIVNGSGTGSGTGSGDGSGTGSGVTSDSIYTNMVTNTTSAGDAAKNSAKAALDIALQNQLTSLEKTYQDAVANGEISVRDAKDAYDKQAAALNQQYYREMKNAGLYSQEMGIQNSNQSLGQQASASERNIANVNQNAMVRDKAINDIKTSLNNLRTKTDLDVNTAKANYASSLIKSNSDIDMNVLNQLNQLGMWKGDQLFQTSEREASQKFTTSERIAGQEYNTSERIAGQEYNTSERKAGQEFTAGENVLNRKFQTSERVAGEKFTASENAANRTLQTTLQNDEQAFQASENSKNRANNVKIAGINNSNNGYKTPNDMTAMVLSKGFVQLKNGTWSNDGGKTSYPSIESAFGSFTNTVTDKESAQALGAFDSLKKKGIDDSVISTGGDFSYIDPIGKQNEGKYKQSASYLAKDFGKTFAGTLTMGLSNISPSMRTSSSVQAAKDDVKSYNAQVKTYTQMWQGLPESVRKSGQYKAPPALRKWNGEKVVEVENKYLKK